MKRTGTKKKGILIDSCGWIEYFSDAKAADEYGKYIEKANPHDHVSPSIVLYEVYKKIKSTVSEEEAMRAVAYIRSSTEMIDLTDSIALTAADISIRERLPMADSIIYATAKIVDATVVTSDGDFKNLPNVIFIENK